MRWAGLFLYVAALVGAPCDTGRTGLVWHMKGDWQAGGKALGFMDSVLVSAAQPASPSSDSYLVVLLNGRIAKRSCPAGGACSTNCASEARQELSQRTFTRVTSGNFGGPEFRAAMSRAAGWSDSVIPLADDGQVDLSEVFSGLRARRIRLQFCAIQSVIGCDTPFITVDWNGKSGIASARGLTPGLYRITEDSRTADAWVRVVEEAKAPAVRNEYEAAVSAIEKWKLPDSDEALPSLDRLWRVVLASVGEEQ